MAARLLTERRWSEVGDLAGPTVRLLRLDVRLDYGSASGAKTFVALFEILLRWPGSYRTWCRHSNPIHFLKTMSQHWTVNLVEYVAADFDYEIGTNSEDISIERGVVDLA
jgi:hypothetical protein